MTKNEKYRSDRFSNIRGQFLAEILVALTVGAIIIGAATGAITLMLRKNADIRTTQIATSLANQYSDSLRVFSELDWLNIYNLSKGSSNKYIFLQSATSTATSTAILGEESMLSDNITNSLVGHWKFDEAAGTTAYDFSGNGKNGTSTSWPTKTASSSCKVGSCFSFNGTTNFINDGQVLDADKTKPFTLSAWAKPSSGGMGTWRTIVGTNSSLAEIAISSGDTITFGQNGGGGWFLAGFPAAADAWYHVAGVYDGTNAYLYVDGELKAGPSAQIFTNNHDVTLMGRYSSGGGEWMNGLIDDVRIYNRALSTDEINRLYNSTVLGRYFYIENVNRESCGIGSITTNATTSCAGPGGGSGDIADDPSTQKTATVITWEAGGLLSKVQYLTRYRNKVFNQTDWSGGDGQGGTITEPNDKFASSTDIDFTTNKGSIKIQGM